MDPKPLQEPRPPIIYGGVSPLGAKRAAHFCDGFYPVFLDPFADPHRHADLQDIISEELSGLGRPTSDFIMMAATTMRVTDPLSAGSSRKICSGSAEQIVEDLQEFAAAGYSLVVAKMDCPSGDVSEVKEQIERVGAEVIPLCDSLSIGGDWKLDF